MTRSTTPRVLTVAGSDPSGGAGLQADIAVFVRLGVHPMAIPTALTVQNSTGVARTVPCDAALIHEQLQSLFRDMPPQAVKTGMLADAQVVTALARTLREDTLVIDPVLRASDGHPLITPEGEAALVQELFPRATLITPNRPEAERLLGQPIDSCADAARGARALRAMGPRAVLITGGHLEDPDWVVDTLADETGVITWRHPRLPGMTPHGTGCALSAAIAAHLALGQPLVSAISRSIAYVVNAFRRASRPGVGRPYLGNGSGPPIEVKAER